MLVNPLYHAEPLTLIPSNAVLTYDHHAPQPALAHHSSALEPSLQVHRLEIGVPNFEAREGTAATDDCL